MLCGNLVTRDEVNSVVTPVGTRTHTPIPHNRLLESVEGVLAGGVYNIRRSQYALSHNGNRFFGVLDLESNYSDRGISVGVRNSHDKKFPAAFGLGDRVFVCDNLSFSAEIKLARKHTRNIVRDLDRLVCRAVDCLGEFRLAEETRVARFKETELTDPVTHDLCIRAVDAQAIPVSKLSQVLQEYRQPQHEEFQPRTLWSLFNSFTEVYKGYSLPEVDRKSRALNGLFLSHVGLN